MGSSLPRNSTRARAARSVRNHPKPRRQPASPKPFKPLTAAEVAGTALREIRNRLHLANSTAIVVHHALRGQNVILDDDAADVLRRYVSDVLFEQILNINRLLGEDDDGGAP